MSMSANDHTATPYFARDYSYFAAHSASVGIGPTARPTPTSQPTKKAQPVKSSVKLQKQQGFFDWFLSLFLERE
jgi:hypothetical protein